MRSILLTTVLLATACGGPSGSTKPAKTPAQLLADQEAMASREEGGNSVGDYDDTEVLDDYEGSDEELATQFDERQAVLEISRAKRSATTCGEVVAGGPRGTAKGTLIFQDNGHVKESSLEAPFADTQVGACVLRAMSNVIVPAYEGPYVSKTFEVEVEGSPEGEASDEPAE